MNRPFLAGRCAAVLTLLLGSLPALAEEGGSGHYFPGSMSSFADGAPSAPTFIARFNYAGYDGDVSVNREIPVAGLLAGNVDASSTALGLTLVWAPELKLGDGWSYSMAATIPWVDIEVKADVRDPDTDISVRRSDSEQGLGDLVLIPLMFNYKASADFNINMRLGVYAPTGDYETGRLANTGKNFWTLEPTVGFMYFGQHNGIEGSLFAGLDVNTMNHDTNYESGEQFHLDGTLAQHFPLWGGLAGAGASAYYYRQVGGDSGSGATFGDFKARANGVGPVLSWAGKAGDTDVIAEFKWISEFDNKRRLEGDILWLKILGKW